jgi:DNA repair photolyase
LFETYPQASIIERIQAASIAQNEGGYPSRVRIDPIIPVKNWKRIYNDFLEKMAELKFRPERFTLGLYRVLKRCGHIDKILNTKFAVPLNRLQDTDDCNIQARLRIPLELRVEVYTFMIERIKEIFPESTIGVCKETNELRTRIGLTDNDTNCNCTQ